MNTKLTLKLDEEVIQQAKIYAASQNRSLSGLVEGYLKSLVNKNEPDKDKREIKISHFVKSMTSGTPIPTDLDLKEYSDQIVEKYR